MSRHSRKAVKRMTVADIQYRMSQIQLKIDGTYAIHLNSSWSVNDAINWPIDLLKLKVTPSRNQREGYFDGRCYGRYTRGGYNSYPNNKVRASVSDNLSNRKQRKRMNIL